MPGGQPPVISVRATQVAAKTLIDRTTRQGRVRTDPVMNHLYAWTDQSKLPPRLKRLATCLRNSIGSEIVPVNDVDFAGLIAARLVFNWSLKSYRSASS